MLLRKTDVKTIFTLVSFLTGSILHTTSYADQKNFMSFTNQDSANAAYTTATRDALQINPEIQGQMNAIKTANSHLDQHVGSNSNIHDAKNTLHSLESRYSSTLAEKTGVSVKELDEMRSSGMTWGQVSHEIGVRVNDMVDSELGTQGAMFSGNQLRQGAPRTENMTLGYPQNYNATKQMQEMGINSQEMTAATERDLFSGGVSGHGIGIQSTGIHRGTRGSMSGAGGLSNGMGYVSINEAMSNPDEGGMGGAGGGMGGSGDGMGGSGGGMGGSGGGMGGSGGGGMH